MSDVPVPAEQSVQNDCAVARRLLQAEAEALLRLADELNESFSAAVTLLLRDGGGRVIVTGMGKSGHIGCKIAATLASTGCPAFFVHPGEASHGDLGMVTPHDVVLALSNSGETLELGDIVQYTRRFSIPLVGITSKPDSALGQAADVALILPPVGEACPMGLAPTTSTTMMLALGDALAVALLERRRFTPSDFRRFHPGGQLGQRLLRVRDLMHSGNQMPLVRHDQPMGDVLLVITAKSFGCVGVQDDSGRLSGIVTDGDLRRHLDPSLFSRTAGEVMTARPKTCQAAALAVEALSLMNQISITSLFVVDADGKPEGILHLHDCLRAGIA